MFDTEVSGRDFVVLGVGMQFTYCVAFAYWMGWATKFFMSEVVKAELLGDTAFVLAAVSFGTAGAGLHSAEVMSSALDILETS